MDWSLLLSAMEEYGWMVQCCCLCSQARTGRKINSNAATLTLWPMSVDWSLLLVVHNQYKRETKHRNSTMQSALLPPQTTIWRQSSSESKSSNHQQFEVTLSLAVLKKLCNGVEAILPQCTHVAKKFMVASNDCSSVANPMNSIESSPWVVQVDGSLLLSFIIDDDLDDKLQIKAQSPWFTQGTAKDEVASFLFKWQALTVWSKIDNIHHISIDVSKGATQPGKKNVVFWWRML